MMMSFEFESMFTLAQTAGPTQYFWLGAVLGGLVAGVATWFIAKQTKEDKYRGEMLAIERERAARHAEMDRAAAQRAESIEQTQIARIKNEVELSAINIEIAKHELADRKAASEGGGVSNSHLHKLQAAKFEREVAMLDAQVELSRRDLAMRGDQLDFHDTRMEQSRLEIESLKLQIREQKKRLDEFGHGE